MSRFRLLLLIGCIAAVRARHKPQEPIFAFTAPVYNITLEENASGNQFANSLSPIRMGVPLPDKDSTVKFKIVEGDRNHLFKAHSRQIGDFVFLRIRQKDKNVQLNRELKDSYEFIIKATCQRKNAANLETKASVKLKITDRNDAPPMFTLDADRYETEITDKTEPFTKILRVEASDADIGLNGEIYYSLVNKSTEFMVDPITGWVKTLKSLRPGSYEFFVRAEDRTSRVFYSDEYHVQPHWTAEVFVKVTETKKSHLRLLVENRSIFSTKFSMSQLAALIRLEGNDNNTKVSLANSDHRHWFYLNHTGDHWSLFSNAHHVIPPGTNVTVVAGNPYSQDGNTSATIKIDFASEHGISFSQSKMVFSIDECSPVGSIIGDVTADLANPDDLHLVTYKLEWMDKNVSLPVTIGASSGTLRLKGVLDFEKQTKFVFTVVAKLSEIKNIPFTSTEVELMVMDCNDHPPVFAAKWQRQGPISIASDAKLGSVLLKVEATDLDSGDNGKISYKLSSIKDHPFEIDHTSGEIILAKPLPKNFAEWGISVLAVDWGRPLPRSSILNLVFYKHGTKIPSKPKPVIVTESPNSAAPTFKIMPSSISVAEDTIPGKRITTISASDIDSGYNGLVRYSTVDDYFSIDAETGDFRVLRDLRPLLKDGQAKVLRQIEIVASDLGSPQKFAKKMLTMEILDVNDHAPVFDQPWYRIRVSEDVPTGQVLLKVTATDVDAGDSGRISYRFVNTNVDVLAVEENSGKVVLQRPLDRESSDILSYTLVAIDHGSPAKLSFANLTVEVLDVNDNAPVCVQPFGKVRIPEDYPDGALVGCLAAHDSDLGANSRLRFSIETKATDMPFRIDHHSGCIFIDSPDRPLDYQKKNFYNISVDVADNGESMLISSCHFVVELIDVDENLRAPEFDDVAHEASVYENMPVGTEVFTVRATDPDRKEGNLRYSITGGDGWGFFSIDDNGAIRSATVLDRELKNTYWLAIEAQDDATRPKSAVLHVFVKVLDKNDHRPLPSEPIYFASVAENSPQNTVVVKLAATDGDDIDGSFQQLTYKIVRGDPQSFFRIDPNTGYIVTSGSRRLDRETQSSHELWVAICDSGEPQLCSEVPVEIKVEDINDNGPKFNPPIHHFSVPAGVTGVIARVFASDPDEGVNSLIFYNASDGDSRFVVDSDGFIKTSSPLSPDEVFSLVIVSTDYGMPAKRESARVVLTAMAQPKHSGPNRPPAIRGKENSPIHISDADQVGLVVAMLDAADEDDDPLWWSILEGNPNNTFALRADTGALMLAKPLDQLSPDITEVKMLVKVTDGELEDKKELTLQLSRSPSTRPQFTAQRYKTEVSEKTPIGSQIYTIKTTDTPATLIKKPTVYFLAWVEDTTQQDLLRIEPNTGNVVVVEPLDFESSREITCIVAARQGQLTNYATLVVKVTDDNDNAPRFSKNEMEVTIAKNLPVGAVVVVMEAFDADSGANGIIKYSIVSGNELGFFIMDQNSGIIRIASKYNDHVESILTIRATDGGKPALSATTSLRLISAAVDKYMQFKFTKAIYQSFIPESSPIGTVVVVISTIPAGVATYYFEKPCSLFDVHPHSGAVTLARWLSSERSKSLQCTVVGLTRDGDKKTAKVVVKPVNSNQHSPVFKQQVYRGFIRENAAAGTAVLLEDSLPLLLSATDRDIGPHALVAYRIVNENDPYFVVDYVSGAIRSRKPMDFEKTKEWSFHVQANDMGHPPRASPVPALVIVEVIDENDEAPVFASKEMKYSLFLPTIPGVHLLKVEAVDADSVGTVRYFLKKSKSSKLFSLDANSGWLKTAGVTLNYTDTNYKLDIIATDGVHSTSGLVLIDVMNHTVDSGFRCDRQEYVVSIKENQTFAEGEHLISVTAIGSSDSVPATYSLVTEDERFILNQGTGLLALNGIAFDREIDETVQLVIKALSGDAIPRVAYCIATVSIEDVNDCEPNFIGLPYETVVSSKSKVGDKVINVKAIDKDSGTNGMVRYLGEIPKQFKLNKNDGRITVAMPLEEGKTYKFIVEAHDRGTPSLKSTAEVIITAVNEAKPMFSENRLTASVSKTATTGTTITTVKAVSSVGGRIAYSLKENNTPFVIDTDSGSIMVHRPLAYSAKSEYNLTVIGSDVTRTNMDVELFGTIKVVDFNDQVPRFPNATYRISIAESSVPNSELLTVHAETPDGNGAVSYAGFGADASVVNVNSNTGQIVLVKPLDYEKKTRYTVNIRASDSSLLTDEAQLVIDVTDVNDEPPRFLQPFASAELSDAASPGQFITVLSAIDDDTVASLPNGQRLLYSVIDGDDTLFIVDSHSGQVVLGRPLSEDEVQASKHRLNVSVSDGIFTAYTQLIVSIIVSGELQPPPRFEQSQYAIRVKETSGSENRSVLLALQAHDGVSPLHFSLGGGKDARWPVRIDKITGKLYQKKISSRNGRNVFVIPLIVEDALGRKAFSTLTLSVVDENDSAPKFVVKRFITSISSTTKEGDLILALSATDDDDNDVIEYSIVDPESSSLFRVHHRQGLITLNGKLDEHVGSELSFDVKATDEANPPHHSVATVVVNVLSADIPVPKFSNSHYLFSVAENTPIGSTIGKLHQIESAVEAVRFSIVEPPDGIPVMIERSSGKLVIRGLIDREEQKEWRFGVRVDAPQKAHAMTTVTIRVSDVNDNAPVFYGSYAKQSIAEDAAIGTSIAVFSATDADDSPGSISFSIVESEGSDVVKMDADSGWLMVNQKLDRERRPFYDLTARATDEAGNAAELPFRLEVTDVNDQPPRFDGETYVVNLDPDQAAVGASFLRVTVTDSDLPPFNSTNLFISKGNELGLFAIDNSGRLSVRNLRFPMDIKFFNLTLVAFDGKFTSTADVKVNINRSSPRECPEPLSLRIEENSKNGTIMYNSTLKNGFIHQIISHEEIPFSVDGDTGTIWVSGKIDYEKRDQYSFVVLSKSRSLECRRKIAVDVIDLNDNLPIFSQLQYTVAVKENQAATPENRYFVVRVDAKDADSGDFGQVKYTLADGHGFFVIDERNGAVTLTAPLDREQRDNYVLHVLARDSDPIKPKSSKTTIRITVADQNDNAPIFERTEYSLQVMESESLGYELVTVHAEGGDSGETVTYSLVDGPHNGFVKLNPTSGVLSLTSGLDFEKERLLTLTIVATDNGSPPMKSEAKVTIQVMDENDNAPVFVKDSYRVEVKENVKYGTVVLKVEARDLDSEHYGRIEYSMKESNVPFLLDANGTLLVSGDVDYEKEAHYRLTAVARDGGNLTAEVTVVVEVKNENDNPPVFDVCNMTAVVQEGVQPGHVVMSISAKDLDGPPYGSPFKVKLTGEGHRVFMIDEHMNILTAARLDHSKKDKFLLTVELQDQGGLRSDCPLTIYVKEESRHPPQIVPSYISLNTLKGEFKGGMIGRISAKDEDGGDMLRYALVDGSILGPLPTDRVAVPSSRRPHTFRIDSETGQIYANSAIPGGLHAMNVSVTDGKFNAVSYVEVDVVPIEQDNLDHAVAVRVLGVTPEMFLSQMARTFKRVYGKYLNVRPENIHFISIQPAKGRKARAAESTSGVDLLFTVARGFDGVDRGMMKPENIYMMIKQAFSAISQESDLHYEITTEVCYPGACARGECRERIELSDIETTIISVDGNSLVAPRHNRYASCSCPEGFGGARCDLEVNLCSRSPCESFEMCTPDSEQPLGYECVCPPGTTGHRCRSPACSNEGRCLEEAEISVSGNGFFEISIANDVESRMELEIEIRTVTADGTILYDSGSTDSHALLIRSGRLQYRWNSGSGDGLLKLSTQISDGKWHKVRVSRRSRRTRMTLDDSETVEGYSPVGTEIVNLKSAGLHLTFGAQVDRINFTKTVVKDGVAACFRTISLDGRSIAKTRQGLRLYAATPGCRAMTTTPCSDAPCLNGATCHAVGKAFTCICPSRYEGDRCEIDRDPCGDHPCPVGIQCIPYYNQYLCKCPDGFTGKHCEGRGYNLPNAGACAARPCGSGECIPLPPQPQSSAGFICNCTHGLTVQSCDHVASSGLFGFSRTEILVLIVILLVIICAVLLIICYCRFNRQKRVESKLHEQKEIISTNHHSRPQLPSTSAPPLPPRTFRAGQAAVLPTMEVRPYHLLNERMNRGDSRSPSLAGSSGKQWKHNRSGSAGDDLNSSGTYDAKQLEDLRRFGVPLDDDASSSGRSAPSRVSRGDRRRGREASEALNRDRYALADSIQCLPTTDDEPRDRWQDNEFDRIHDAVQQERLKLENLTNRVHIGDTILSPVVNDDDYMTMRPRKPTDTTESQRRPLLSSSCDGLDDSEPPPLPAHKTMNPVMETSRLYDDPAYDSRKNVTSRSLSSVCNIDSDLEEL